jgi:kynureninase
MTMEFENIALENAINLDKQDQLAGFREKFYIDDEKIIYLDGNSLGRLPITTKEHLDEVISQEWGSRLIQNWNEGWYDRPTKLAAKIAKLIGAQPNEVILSDSTSVNLYKLAYAAIQGATPRKKIISDELNFPSDLYILQGILAAMGKDYQLDLIPSRDEMTIQIEDIEKMVDDNTALLTLSHVAFKSAFLHDMKSVTQIAHNKGSLVLWDLSHSVGVIPIQLHEAGVDLAIGCTYKYLNGGPGSPAFLYVKKELQQKLLSPIWGWFGDHSPFEFRLRYQPSKEIQRFVVGTPPILSLSALEPALDLIQEAKIENLRTKSVHQTEYLIYLFEEMLISLGFTLGTPLDHEQRGSHVSFRHPEAYRICQALIDPEYGNFVVIPDFREPDNIRLGISPLYTSFSEIFYGVQTIRYVVQKRLYEKFDFARSPET